MKPVLEKVELLLRTNRNNATAKNGALPTPSAALRSSLGVPVSFNTHIFQTELMASRATAI